ncbi:MAG TPA: glycosyltransferase 87 family protein [Actinomycetes bacterium]|nr:glycosyltransferase 87 family protein [Actinomycetes bacterium]
MRRVDAILTSRLVRLLAWRPQLDGRAVVLAAVALYVTAAGLARLLWSVDLRPWLGVPPGPSVFFDTRNITAALECRRLGYDPLVENPCDPWGRAMFYPRVWLLLRWLGVDQSDTLALGVLIGLLFLVSLCLLTGRISAGEGIVVAVAVCSPAVMLALERANMDVVLFSVLVAAVLLWRRGTELSRTLSPLLVLVAATGKLYPVFGLPAYAFLRNRRAALAAAGCGLLFLAYVAVTLDDVRTVAATATQGQHYSYGARILIGQVYHLVAGQDWQGGSMVAQALAAVPLLVLVVILWAWARRRLGPGVGGASPAPTAELLAFYLGALLYVGTFAVFRNYDYRLVYLLLTLPQLMAWVREGRAGDPLRTLAGLALAAVVLDLWIGSLSEQLRLAEELVSWAVAGLLVALSATSVPRLSKLLLPTRSGSR